MTGTVAAALIGGGAAVAQNERAVAPAAAAMDWKLPDAPDAVLAYQSDGSVRMAGSGFRFPARLGAMALRRKIAISASDVMVDYSDRGAGNGDPWVDVIVFDYGTDLAREADRAVVGVKVKWSDLADAGAVLRLPPAAADARQGWWTGGQQGMRMLTGFVMVQRGRWIVEYRASCPAPCDAAGVGKMQAALDALDWQALAPSA